VNLPDFSHKVSTSLKFMEDSNWNMFQNYNMNSVGKLKLGPWRKLFTKFNFTSLKSLNIFGPREGI
jgi:hypothetical protein